MKRLADREQAARLDAWVDTIQEIFSGRILPVDLAVARTWGELSARRPFPEVDGLIAATAIARNLTLVTRNTRDVADTGVTVVDPWQEPAR